MVTLARVTGQQCRSAVKYVLYGSEFAFTITGSGEAGGVAYSAGMTIDEGGIDDTAAVSMSSTGGFTLAYDKNDFGGLVDAGT